MKKLIATIMLCGIAVQAGTVAGPKGGKLLDTDGARAEFLVNATRNVEIRFYDAALNPVALGDQVVNVIAEAPSGKVRLEMTKIDAALVSSTALPEGDGYTVVVQIKASSEAKNQNFRIVLHKEICGGCQLPEYACICDHAGKAEDSHEGHGH